MLRSLAIVAPLLLASCDSPASFAANHVQQIEAQIEMPPGATPIGSYARFYSSTGSHIIKGEFVSPEFATVVLEHRVVRRRIGSAIYVVDENDMPHVMDGGCGVLTLSYDTSDGVLTGPACNGSA